ncbi:MAG TPA: sugar phosphate isomerase/epimerase [Candidatus Latescibacteria bacterium]|nr:sugar phosphate isomerase/epimerase [Candidatus Latescibacterota bacterium]
MKLAWLMDVTEENLKLLHAAAYDGIEPFVTRQFNPEKVTVREAKALKHMVDAAGLEISALCGLYPGELQLLSSDPLMQQRSKRYSSDLIKLASDMGISLLAFGSGGSRSLPPDVPKEEGLKRLREFVYFCGERAQEVGVRIAIEQLNRYETNILNRLDEVVAFVRDVNSPAVGVTADLFHMNIEDADLGQAIRNAGSLLWHIHLADSNRRPPGQGHLNLTEVMEALHQIGYEGYLSMEANLTPDPATALAMAKRTLKAFGV